ncbi:MAG: permease [Planctomycetota bacterium]|nr:MAG: permease [Planctomycetota bacterium]
MNDASNPYASWGLTAAEAETSDRASFIRLTYIHLLGAVLAFIGLEAFLLSLPQVPDAVNLVLGTRLGWFVVLGAFIGVSYIANSWASSSTSVGMQYAGLSLFVVAEAVIFVPLLYVASKVSEESGVNVIGTAGVLTVITFLALTVVVFLTGADFSFLRTGLAVGAIVALITIGASMILGFNLGILFIGAMLLLASGYILYDTSNVLHHYRIGQHVAASLALFASLALLFWYMVQLVMSRR